MSALDFGVITFKNGKLLKTDEENGWMVFQGASGEFKHATANVSFYRMSIRSINAIAKNTVVYSLYSEMIDLKKKVRHFEINGLAIKTKEIYPHTFLSKFKDENGDSYTVIHGYDVSFKSFWSKNRGKAIQKEIKKLKKLDVKIK